MASRQFTDPDGEEWTVWAVTPQAMSKTLQRLTGSNQERRVPWLTFQSASGDKRRLSPIPDNWETREELDLVELWETATQVPPGPSRRRADKAPEELPE